MNGMREDVPAQRIILALKVLDFLGRGVEFGDRCRSGRSKRVMRIERVAVVQMNLLNWRLGNQVQDIRSRAPESDDCHLAKLELLGNRAYLRPARRRIQVAKH